MATFTICLVLLLTSIDVACPGSPSSDVYLWRYQYLKGEAFRVVTHVHIECAVFNKTLTSEIQMSGVDRVDSVNQAGNAAVVETTNNWSASVNGQRIADDPRSHPLVTFTLGKTGVAIPPREPRDDPFRIGSIWLMALNSLAPESAVMAGEAWRTDVQNLLVDGEKTSIESTIVGLEQVKGRDTLKVKESMSIHPDAAASRSEDIKAIAYYNVDPVAGRLVRSEVILTNVHAQTPESAGVMTIVIKREYEPMPRSGTP